MKLFTTVATVLALLTLCSFNLHADDGAAPAKPKKEKPAPPELSAMTLAGVLTVKTSMKKQKDGTEVEVVNSTLKTDKGVIRLPKSEVDYAPFNGQNVEVVGEGYIKTSKNKKGDEVQTTILKTVTAVTARAADEAADAE